MEGNNMALGPGKYDEETESVRKSLGARGVMLMVVDGSKGSGFSCTGELGVLDIAPGMLRHAAEQIELDVKRLATDPAARKQAEKSEKTDA
jgi:hypothetical protein